MKTTFYIKKATIFSFLFKYGCFMVEIVNNKSDNVSVKGQRKGTKYSV